jgi:hypothetical protein
MVGFAAFGQVAASTLQQNAFNPAIALEKWMC